MAYRKIKTEIWITMIGAIATIIVAIVQFKPFQKNHQVSPISDKPIVKSNVLAGTVVDENSNMSISGAEISIVGIAEQYYTEQNGNFRINLANTIQGPVRVRITKSNYFTIDKSFNLPNESVIIQLQKK